MPLILEISTDNRIVSSADNQIIVRQQNEVVAAIAMREVAAVLVTANEVLFERNFLQNLSAKNIPFVISDKNFRPISLLTPCFYAENNGKICFQQAETKSGLYKKIWQAVISEKVKNRAKVLRSLHKKDMLQKLANKILIGDSRNIDDKSENIYFSEMFGADFQFTFQSAGINAFLQYGYLLLQIIALRYIWKQGLNPYIHLNPKQKSDYFGLPEDLTESFKPLIEKSVYEIFVRDKLPDNQLLTSEYKAEMLQLFNKTYYDGKRLISLFELIKNTTSGFASTLRKNEMRLTFSNYLIEVKEM